MDTLLRGRCACVVGRQRNGRHAGGVTDIFSGALLCDHLIQEETLEDLLWAFHPFLLLLAAPV
jgi:hypothetical protein